MPTVPVQAMAQEELSYDDGEIDFGWATGPTGGAAVLFTPPSTPWLLTKIKVAAGYQYDVSDFYVEIWDSGRNELLRVTYRYDDFFFTDPLTWATIDIPDVKVTGDFYVCVFPNDVGEEHVLWMGGDSDPPCMERSYDVEYPENKIILHHTKDESPWNWCIHAIGQKTEERPVGGEVFPVDKLALLAPYVAALLVIATTATIIKKRRH